MKNPRVSAFILSTLVGLGSLVIYQNCGMPDPVGKQTQPSVDTRDFYRWMPDTLLAGNCAIAANDNWKNYPHVTLVSQTPAFNFSNGSAQGIFLSQSGQSAVKGKKTSDALKLMPQQEIALAPLFPLSGSGLSSDLWSPMQNRYGDTVFRSYVALNSQPQPANKFIDPTLPASGFGIPNVSSVPVPMISFFSTYDQSVNSIFLGLLFNDQKKTFDPLGGSLVSIQDGRGRNMKVGTLLEVDVARGRQIVYQVRSFDMNGIEDPLERSRWSCPVTVDASGNIMPPRDLNGGGTTSTIDFFMVFKNQDMKFIPTGGSEQPSYAGAVCVVRQDRQSQTYFPHVPAYMMEATYGAGRYFFGEMKGDALAGKARWPCVVAQPSAAECYNTSGGSEPDYTLTNIAINESPATGKQAPRWMGVCTRRNN